ELVMPAVQTYDNGDVVRWNQPTVDGQAEPDHPAPHLTLAAVGDGDADPAAASTGSPTSGATNGSDSTARWLGGIGVVLAALALGTGAGALIGSRRGRTREEATA